MRVKEGPKSPDKRERVAGGKVKCIKDRDVGKVPEEQAKRAAAKFVVSSLMNNASQSDGMVRGRKMFQIIPTPFSLSPSLPHI